MKVKLLKRVGDHPEGKELDIEDKTVLRTWVNLGVINHLDGLEDEDENDDNLEDAAKRIYSSMKVDELREVAESKELPKEEWSSLRKDELVKYLTEKA